MRSSAVDAGSCQHDSHMRAFQDHVRLARRAPLVDMMGNTLLCRDGSVCSDKMNCDEAGRKSQELRISEVNIKYDVSHKELGDGK